MAYFEAKNIRKSFGKTEVLRGVSFSMEKGEVLAVLGSSGGGKTTLLRCVNFLEKCDSGSLSLEGDSIITEETVTLKAKKGEEPQTVTRSVYPDAETLRIKSIKMGLVFQDFNLFPQYNVLGNLTLAPMLVQHMSREDAEQLARDMLAKVGLSEKCDAYPYQLSGGQKQRVAIARSLCLNPAVLCFDEPTSALDPELTMEVLKVISSLKKQGVTMLIVTHEIEFAREVADRVIFIDRGVILEEGNAKEVIDNPKTERAREFLKKISGANV